MVDGARIMHPKAIAGFLVAIQLTACATAVFPTDDPSLADDGGAPDGAQKSDASPHVPGTDSATPDASVDPDAATTDAGAPDSSVVDASLVDSAVIDSSVIDSGSVCPAVFKGTLLTFDFTGEPGSQASTAPVTAAGGLTAGSISRVGVAANAGSNSINATGWTTASSPDGSRYYTFTLTPHPKCALDISSVSLDTSSSGTGPINGAIATSDDAFAAAAAFNTGVLTSVNVTVSKSGKAVEIRVYGFNASMAVGTMRIQSKLTVSGALN